MTKDFPYDELEVLRSLLLNGGNEIEKILNHNLTIPLFYQHFPLIIQYFIYKGKDLLNTFIFNENKEISSRAYILLSYENGALIRVLLERKIIGSLSEYLHLNKDINPLIISRICSIIEICLIYHFDFSRDQLWFITLLLEYLNNFNIIFLFKTIYLDCENKLKIRDWLVQLGLITKICEIMNKSFRNKSNSIEIIDPIYQLLVLFLEDNRILEQLLIPSRLKILLYPIQNLNFTKNSLILILKLINEKNNQFLISFIDNFLLNIYNININPTEIQVLLIQIISKLLKYSINAFNLEKVEKLGNFAINLIENNYNHSIFMSSLIELIFICINSFNLAPYLLRNLIFLLKKLINFKYIINLRSICYFIINNIYNEYNNILNNNKDFIDLYNNFYLPLNNILNKEYGGEIDLN